MPSIPMKCLCLSLLATVPIAAGCNRGSADRAGTNPSSSASSNTEVVKPPPPVPQGKSSIAGRIVFEGTPPKPRPINFGPEKACAEMHADKKPSSESLVVNSNGTVKWMLVYLKGKVPGKYKPPAEPVVMDQVGCVFAPHAVGMVAGQEIEFRNSDPVTHNVPRDAGGGHRVQPDFSEQDVPARRNGSRGGWHSGQVRYPFLDVRLHPRPAASLLRCYRR